MSWVYDTFGNRTAQQVVKGSVPVQSVSVDMAANRVSSWGYDANGNATSIPGVGSITYDASNRVKTVGSETYEYDPSNKRIWKNDTYTFWGARGERVGTYSVQLMQYLPEGQQTQVYQLSFVKGTEDWYFGGRRLQVLDRLGSVGGGNNYYPYGEERSATANPADKFATYHRDGTGLDYADQRYYSSKFGRFLTSDPYVASGGPAAPGSWNRYAYVEGDPVSYYDPAGLQACSPGVDFCITVTRPGNVGGGQGAAGGIEGSAELVDIGTPRYASFGSPDAVVSISIIQEWAQERQRVFDSLPAAKDRAKKALMENQDCMEIFGNEATRSAEFDPVKAIDQIFNPAGGFLGGRAVGVGVFNGHPVFSTAQVNPALFFGSGTLTWGWRVEINASMWNDMANGTGDLGVQFQAAALLHEMGHIFARIGGSGGSRIVEDGLSNSLSERNTALVLDKCFGLR
jgi:RHS repeat-associated protein